ncbi:MAG: ParA family protein [Candidatus Hermodarchaeota archaeon]
MKTIAFVSYKGGAGKSVLAANVATYLALEQKRVSILDFDFRGPSLYSLFNIKEAPWLNSYFLEYTVKDTVPLHQVKLSENEDLFVGATKIDPNIEEMLLSRKIVRDFLRKGLKLTQNLKKANFNYCFIDNTAGINLLALNAIVMSDLLTIVARPNFFEIEGLLFILEQIYSRLRDRRTKLCLAINQVPKYAVEPFVQKVENKVEELGFFSKTIYIPCHCTIPTDATRNLYPVVHPENPFTQDIKRLANLVQEILA